ncbi:hypothetical protein [Rhodococcus qingshengii]|uniref:hypothetical protein n=1 Tax=Rhodococcus qingshengii TaxID=334542 RepID=UPI0035DBFD15
MAVTVPEGELDGIKIERFTIEPDDIRNFVNALKGRGTEPGTYTRLMKDGRLWMSDVKAERRDHLIVLQKVATLKAKRVVLNGLGLGMVLKGVLEFDHVEHVDVVEIDPRIIKLAGTHYQQDPRVHIHLADAYNQIKLWPRGACWDVGWSNIWADITTDNLPDMTRLNRSYGRRCTWHGCWGQDMLQSMKAQEKRDEKRYYR